MEVLKESEMEIVVLFSKAKEVVTIDLSSLRVFCENASISINKSLISYDDYRNRDKDFEELMDFLRKHYKNKNKKKMI